MTRNYSYARSCGNGCSYLTRHVEAREGMIPEERGPTNYSGFPPYPLSSPPSPPLPLSKIRQNLNNVIIFYMETSHQVRNLANTVKFCGIMFNLSETWEKFSKFYEEI